MIWSSHKFARLPLFSLVFRHFLSEGTVFQIYFVKYYSCSPDGGYSPCNPDSEIVWILNLKEGKEIFYLEGDAKENRIDDVALSPNGNLVFVANYFGNSYIYDIKSQTVVSKINLGQVEQAKWSPDSTNVAIAKRTSGGHTILIIHVNLSCLTGTPAAWKKPSQDFRSQAVCDRRICRKPTVTHCTLQGRPSWSRTSESPTSNKSGRRRKRAKPRSSMERISYLLDGRTFLRCCLTLPWQYSSGFSSGA